MSLPDGDAPLDVAVAGDDRGMPGRGQWRWPAVFWGRGPRAARASVELTFVARCAEAVARRLESGALTIATVAVLANVALVTVNLVSRSVFSNDLLWSAEAGKLSLSIVAFLGGAIAYRRREFIELEALRARLPAAARAHVTAACEWLAFGLALLLTVLGVDLVNQDRPIVNSLLHVSDSWLVAPVPVGMALLTVFAAERILVRGRRSLPVGVCVAAVTMLVAITHGAWAESITQGGAIAAMGGLALVLVAFGMPLTIVFAVGGVAYFYLTSAPLIAVPSDMEDGIASFLLVSIPFFLLAGYLISEAGLSERLATAGKAVMGRLPGSILHIIVVTMYVFSGISGSKIGDMAAVGRPVLRMCEADGYPEAEGVALLAASAAMGETVPPSLALIVLSSITALSAGALFLAGLLPAVVLALILMTQIGLRFRKTSGAPLQATWLQKIRLVLRSLPVLTVPLVLAVGIVGGVATPTEISAVAVVYCLFLVMVAYRNVTWGRAWQTIGQSAVMSGSILLIIATSTVFARAISSANLPQRLTDLVSGGVLGGRVGFLAASLAVLVVMGMVMEGLPAILVFAPLLLPSASALGINPLQFGVLLVMAIGIGANSPPIGIGLYVAAQIGQTSVERASRAMRAYLPALYLGLIVVASIPVLTLAIPRLAGLA